MRAILTYHSIDDSGSPISVPSRRFALDMQTLATRGVAVVSVDTLLSLPEHMSAVALTFDDAYTNFRSHAWPILRERAWPVTLFVPTGFVGVSNQWDTARGSNIPSLPILDWPSLAELVEQGVTLGAHTQNHPDLRTIDPQALADEITGSITAIERETGSRATGFAYPYGYLNDRVVAETAQCCDWACTTVLAPLDPATVGMDRYRLPRLDAYYLHGPGALTQFGSSTFRQYIRLRSILRRLKGT